MCLVDVDVFEDRSRGVGGRLGDNVDVARALACARNQHLPPTPANLALAELADVATQPRKKARSE